MATTCTKCCQVPGNQLTHPRYPVLDTPSQLPEQFCSRRVLKIKKLIPLVGLLDSSANIGYIPLIFPMLFRRYPYHRKTIKRLLFLLGYIGLLRVCVGSWMLYWSMTLSNLCFHIWTILSLPRLLRTKKLKLKIRDCGMALGNSTQFLR